MTESEFIAAEQAKLDCRLVKQLRKVDKTGEIGRHTAETLLVNDLIQFAGPRPEINNPYNCYRLTERGQKLLGELVD